MQYNIQQIMETLDELENQQRRDFGFDEMQRIIQRLRMQLLSLNRYVDAVATIGALALAKDTEALAIEGAEE
jgi:hypothetical protein